MINASCACTVRHPWLIDYPMPATRHKSDRAIHQYGAYPIEPATTNLATLHIQMQDLAIWSGCVLPDRSDRVLTISSTQQRSLSVPGSKYGHFSSRPPDCRAGTKRAGPIIALCRSSVHSNMITRRHRDTPNQSWEADVGFVAYVDEEESLEGNCGEPAARPRYRSSSRAAGPILQRPAIEVGSTVRVVHRRLR